MRHIIKFFEVTCVGLMLMAAPLMTPMVFAAQGSARLYLSPSSGVVAKGNILSVDIFVSVTGDPVNSVEADLTYPASLLNYVSITNGSAFPVDAGSVGGGGTVNIARASNSPQNSEQLVATVKFTALTDTGTAAINFAKTSQVIRSTDNQPDKLTTLGGNYTLTAQPSTPQTPVNTAQGGSVDITMPAISDLSVTNLGLKSATIVWTTNVPATSEVEYGFDTNYIWQAIDNTLVKDHKVALDSNNLTQGQTYHFIAKSYDSSNNAALSQDKTFKTLSPPPPPQNNTSKYVWLGIAALVLIGLLAGIFYAFKSGLIKLPGKNKPGPPPPPGQNPTANPPAAPTQDSAKPNDGQNLPPAV